MNNIVATNKRVINKPKLNHNKLTLDVQHNNYVQKLQSIEQQKHGYEHDIEHIERDIAKLEKQKEKITDEDEFDRLMVKMIALKDKKQDIQVKIKDLSEKFNEMDYYTHTAGILFEYYDLVEKGNHHLNECHAPKAVPATENSILKYFKQSQTGSSPKVMTSHDDCDDDAPSSPKDGKTNRSRGTLLEQYMKYTDPNYMTNHYHQLQHTSDDACSHCHSRNIVMVANDGYIVCTDCDCIEYIIVDHEKPSYKDPPKEISFYAYKRINHLNEWISQIQGKETTEIPEEVYDRILLEIKKQRITNMADVTCKTVRAILKKLKINKYYEHSAHIISRLNGNPIPQLSSELEEKLRNMFKQIQTPFVKYAPPKRKNFLSYSFCLHKFLQLLGEDHLLENFPLLKSRDKLHQQDQIWKKICEDLGWEFVRSI